MVIVSMLPHVEFGLIDHWETVVGNVTGLIHSYIEFLPKLTTPRIKDAAESSVMNLAF